MLILLHGNGSSPFGEVSEQFTSRLARALALLKSEPESELCFFAADTYRTASARDIAYTALSDAGIPRERLYSDPRAMSTRGEVELFVRYRHVRDPHGAVVQVTSLYHAPRASLLLRQESGVISRLETVHTASWRDTVLEPLKLFRDALPRPRFVLHTAE